MGVFYQSIVFYGIVFEEREFSSLLSKIRREMYGRGIRGRDRDFKSALIKTINRKWMRLHDPTRLFQRVGCFGGVYSSLYIKGTLHHAGPVADGYVDRSFHLDIDTRAWDRLLQRVCDEFKFPREPPAFYVGVYEREGATGGSFYYGMSIDERDLFAGSNLLETLGIDKTFGIDKETYLNLSTKRPRFLLRRGIAPEHLVHTLNHCWHEKRTPVTITLHRNWDSDLYYLVINQSRQVGGSFKLDGVDLAPWNHLLRAKCERYGIRGKTPSFHLNVIPI